MKVEYAGSSLSKDNNIDEEVRDEITMQNGIILMTE